MDVSKSDIDKPFKLNGLFLLRDASQYLLTIIQRVEPSKRQKVLNRILEAILKQKISDNRIDKAICENAINDCKTDRNTDAIVFHVVDAFTVPRFVYSKQQKKFVPFDADKPNVHRLLFSTSVQDRSFIYAHRYEVVYQRMLRHQVFSQSAVLDDSKYVNYRLRPIEYILASAGRIDSVVILAMLTKMREGEWHAEDPTGIVKLNLQQAIFHEGLFPEGSILLIEGFYDEKILYTTGIGLPPCESSDVTRRAFSVSNTFGGGAPGALAAPQDAKMHRLLTNTQAGAEAMLVLLGETRLDQPTCMDKLRVLFAGFTSCPPVAFVLTGNFLSSDTAGRSCAERRQMLQKLLLQLIAIFRDNFPDNEVMQGIQKSNTHQQPQLILVPGPDDPVNAPAHILPRPGLPSDLVTETNSLCPSWLQLASNPCRLRLYTREIVIFRVNYSRLLVRHCIHLPTLNSDQSKLQTESTDDSNTLDTPNQLPDNSLTLTDSQPSQTSYPVEQLNPFERLGQGLARCLASQSHLLPVLGHIAPVYWYHDQALSLHPLPNLVVAVEPKPLADLNAAQTGLNNTGNCRFINPGSFDHASTASHKFKVYYPRSEIVEDSCLPDD